ncbi:hypothetical protein J1N35_044004 [Gossypium stocksii]|uniref:Uncharacterized protein n=1 Tax=Gossypium stocksii TaxID=47602 RepID=A0A9D3U8I8_9ROSI|nr:hypothetical protein J1N35_044004 [Gossypium stocksii]
MTKPYINKHDKSTYSTYKNPIGCSFETHLKPSHPFTSLSLSLFKPLPLFFIFFPIPLPISPFEKESFNHHLKQHSSVRGSIGSTRTSGEGGEEQTSQASEKHRI